MSGDCLSIALRPRRSRRRSRGRRRVADLADRLARDLLDVDVGRRSRSRRRRPRGRCCTSVSQATRPYGSSRRTASRTPSEIWSATLSGWPSVTDSDVNRYSLSAYWLMGSERTAPRSCRSSAVSVTTMPRLRARAGGRRGPAGGRESPSGRSARRGARSWRSRGRLATEASPDARRRSELEGGRAGRRSPFARDGRDAGRLRVEITSRSVEDRVVERVEARSLRREPGAPATLRTRPGRRGLGERARRAGPAARERPGASSRLRVSDDRQHGRRDRRR